MQIRVVRQEVHVIASQSETAMLAGEERHVISTPVIRQLVLVFPDDLAGAAVYRKNLVVLRKIEHTLVVTRGCLGVGLAAGGHDPRNLELLRIASIDLIQRAEAVRSQVAVGMQPRSTCFGRQLTVGHPRQAGAGQSGGDKGEGQSLKFHWASHVSLLSSTIMFQPARSCCRVSLPSNLYCRRSRSMTPIHTAVCTCESWPLSQACRQHGREPL